MYTNCTLLYTFVHNCTILYTTTVQFSTLLYTYVHSAWHSRTLLYTWPYSNSNKVQAPKCIYSVRGWRWSESPWPTACTLLSIFVHYCTLLFTTICYCTSIQSSLHTLRLWTYSVRGWCWSESLWPTAWSCGWAPLSSRGVNSFHRKYV